ncbi:hypothetical protein VTK56DRAFT_7281 [Thermocarpiscus australiensis]
MRDPLLATCRRAIRWRYGEMLKTERFREWAGAGGFGRSSPRLRGSGCRLRLWGGGLEQLFRGGKEDDTDSEDERGDGGGEERASKEALRFLSGYGERVYERDAGVRKPDPKLEVCYVKKARHRRRGQYGTGRP